MTAPWQPIPQVLPEIATNMYRGKAMRQELSTAKKQEELLDLEIKAAKNPPVDTKEQRAAADQRAKISVEADAASVAAWDNAPEGSTDEERKGLAVQAGLRVLQPYLPEGADLAGAFAQFEGNFDIDAMRASSGYEEPSGAAPTELTKLQGRLNDPDTNPADIPAIQARIKKLVSITGTMPLLVMPLWTERSLNLRLQHET